MSAAQELTRTLRGSWHGHYGIAGCPAHDDKSPSLSIANGTNGRLLLKCHAGCSFDAVSAALSLSHRSSGWQSCRHRAEAEQQTAIARSKQVADQARAIWTSALPICGTPAERYLRSRGIACALPSTLGYAPKCWHLSAKRLPALLGNVTIGTGAAIHRTYITPDGSGKASVTPAKAMLGRTKGGAVRLASASQKLVVAEGIETTLSLMSGLYPGDHSFWATLSASGMAELHLPEQPGQLVIAGDGDKTGFEAAEKLANRAHATGWRVSLFPAPDGQDWNDVLQSRGMDS